MRILSFGLQANRCAGAPWQVAGRVHVEVQRVISGLEEHVAGGEDAEGSTEGEAPERLLICMVSNVDSTVP